MKKDNCLAQQVWFGIMTVACFGGMIALLKTDFELSMFLGVASIIFANFSNTYSLLSSLKRL